MLIQVVKNPGYIGLGIELVGMTLDAVKNEHGAYGVSARQLFDRGMQSNAFSTKDTVWFTDCSVQEVDSTEEV